MKTFSPQLIWQGRSCIQLLLLLLLAGLGNALAQVPAWQSALAIGGAQVYATAADASGNVYLAGTFDSAVTFGATTLLSEGSGDIFVAKWSSTTGRFVWAQRAGSFGSERATGIAVSDNSVFIVGDFSSPTLRIGGSSIANTSTNNTYPDIFIAKLTDAGNTGSFSWARQAGGDRFDLAPAIAVSGSSVYIAGYYDSATISFGSNITLSNYYSLAPGSTTPSDDIFVAKLSDAGSTGTFDWATRAGGIGNEEAYGLATNGTSVYVVGSFTSSVFNFGAVRLTNSGAGNEDAVFGKLNTAGSIIWALTAGGSGPDIATAVAATGNDLFVTGFFGSNPASFGSTALATVGASDAFVAKVADAGPSATFSWAQRAGGSGLDTPRAITTSGTDVYVTGYFNSPTASFGANTLTNVAAPGTNSYDIFVCALTSTGSFAAATQAGSPANDFAVGTAASGSTIYIVGDVALPASFGAITLPQGNDSRASFLAALGTPALAATAPHPPTAVVLYPNPSQHSSQVIVPAQHGQGNVWFTLTDGLGRVVHRHSARSTATGLRYTLPLDGLRPGVYLLQVQTEHGQQVRRLVVE